MQKIKNVIWGYIADDPLGNIVPTIGLTIAMTIFILWMLSGQP